MMSQQHFQRLACCAILAALPSCMIHPLPGDIPQVPTSAIVARIRCEVQEGLKSYASAEPEIRRYVDQLIKGTTIGYEFLFTISETNAAAEGQLIFTENRFLGSTFTLELNPSATLQRTNTRAFLVLEELAKVGTADCSPEASSANWAYPITGATGMAEVIRSYIRLQLLSGLAKDPVDKGTIDQVVDQVVFSDALTYKTNLTAGVNPELTLGAGAGSFRLTKASLTGTASRDDLHQVTVALSFDAKKTGASAALLRERQQWLQNEYLFDSRALRRVAQLDSGVRNRVLIELLRRRKVREDATVASRVLGTPVPLP
jgi:hypothetical protein